MFNVTKRYDNGIIALDNISASIDKEEFVFIVGPSGAGKSTFIKLIYREILPTIGQVIINGRNINRLKKREVPYFRRNIGVIFQDFRLIETKTVFENVAFSLEVTETPAKEIKRRVYNVLEMVGLTHKVNDRPLQLSGGEQQRTAIARAIVNNPSLVVADEPTGNLDPKTSRQIMDIFKEINMRGATVVIASHALDIINEMNKRTIVVENHRIKKDIKKGAVCI